MRNPRCHLPSTLKPRIKTTLYKKLSSAASPPRRAARFSLVAAILVACAAMLYTTSSASLSGRSKKADVAQPHAIAKTQTAPASIIPETQPRLKTAGIGVAPLAALLRQVSFADSVATFDTDCVTPKVSWNLGNTVCATVSGPVGALSVLRRVELVNPAGLTIASMDLTTSPQVISFAIPSDVTTDFNGILNPGLATTIDNRGTWHIVSRET